MNKGNCLLVAVLPLVLLSRSLAADTLEDTRKLAIEWVRLRADAAKLETDWSVEKSLLEASNKAMEARIHMLEEKRDALRELKSKDLSEEGRLGAQNQQASETMHAAEDSLRELTLGLEALRPQLPPRLSAALELPFQSLREAALPPGERMQLVMTVLNRCLQFNRTLSYVEETAVVDAAAPKGRVLRVLYWGLAQAYGYDSATGKAYRGAPSRSAWTWTELPGAGPQVERLLAVHLEKAEPEQVEVPALLAGSAGRKEGAL
jgi:hypothetical protein